LNGKTFSVLNAKKVAVLKKKVFRSKRFVKRAFEKFSTEEAWTFVIRFKGKRRFCRVSRTNYTKGKAVTNLLVLDLFHRLYPKNSITPVGIVRISGDAVKRSYPEEFAPVKDLGDDILNIMINDRAERRAKGLSKYPIFGVVTEIERGMSPDFRNYQKELRTWASFSKSGEQHKKFVKEVAVPLGKKIYNESGISVTYTGNMANRDGNPVYFEPKITAPKKLIELINLKSKKERVELMRIARQLGIVP